MRESELDSLRLQIKQITSEIMVDIQRRLDLAKKIGEIKSNLKLDIQDEKAEEEIRRYVLNTAKEIGMNTDFAGNLINILINESVRLQQPLNNNTNGITDNTIPTHLSIFLKAKELESSGKKIIHMEVGEPDYPPPSVVKEAFINAFDNGHYHYTDTRGIYPLREAICKKLKRKITTDEIIITPGARFGVFCAFSSILRPGEETICFDPSWPAYKDCATLCQSRIRILHTKLEDNWNPDIDQLQSLINSNTKMLVLNYPNNPTGKIIDSQTLNGIVEIAKDNNLYLLSDEVYSDFSFTKFKSILDYDYDKSIVVSSFSKGYGMTGFRIGYAISSKDIISKITKIQATALTSVSEPIQYCALKAIDENTQDNVKLIQDRLNIVCNRLRKMSFDFYYPDGSMFVFPKIKHNLVDISLVEQMLASGVAIAPGRGFGSDYRNFIRISASQPIVQLENGLDILDDIMEKYLQGL